jgi:uncharacterized protein (DUF58 family)
MSYSPHQQISSNVVSNGIFCSLAELFHEGQKSAGRTLHLRRKARAQSGGLKRSSIRGRGMEFFESRPYVPQDEIRSIDWKVSARLNSLYTKIFVEEKNRPLYFVLDLRPHMFFGTKNCFKSVLLARIAARLAFAGLNGGDQVGALIFNGQNVVNCPPSMRRNHLSRFFGALADATQKKDGEVASDFWAPTFKQLCHHVHRGAQVFLISDFLGLDDTLARPWLLRLLKNTDVLALKLSDPLEIELPNIGTVGMSYGSHQIIFDSQDKNIHDQFKSWYLNAEKQQRELFRSLDIPFLEFKTSEDLDVNLNRLFSGKW